MSSRGPRQPLSHITSRYDRVAPLYAVLQPLFLITRRARRKAVAALRLSAGAEVLEVGVGSGRNLPYLIRTVGPTGHIVGVDASAGMLRQARRLVARRGWTNVDLHHADANELEPAAGLDAVLFALSYSVIPDPAPALRRAWAALRPGGRLVIMDAGITETRLRRLLAPVTRVLLKLGPGDPYSRPWEDLAAFGDVDREHFMLGIYFVVAVTKRP